MLGRHDQAPLMIAHRVNDTETLDRVLAKKDFRGIEVDIHDSDGWVVSHDRPADGAQALDAFLDEVIARRGAEEHDPPLNVMLEIKSKPPGPEPWERLLDVVRAREDRLEVMFLSFDLPAMHELRTFLMRNGFDRPCQVFVSGDGKGRLQWRMQDLEGLPPTVGVHLRLHTFPRTKTPTFEEVHMMRRPISLSGWHPLIPGWRKLDLSQIWNIRDLD